MDADSKRLALAKLLLAFDPEKERTYYEALGRFVAVYARAEAQVHVLTRFHSGASDEQARLLLSGMRLTDVSDRLRSLLRIHVFADGILYSATRQSIFDQVDQCLTQLSLISERRGELVHRISTYAPDGFEVSNLETAKQVGQIERRIITHADLKEMTFDCGMIFLTLHHFQHRAPGENPFVRSALGGKLPWSYKSALLNPPKAKPMKARKARKLQRGASQEKP